MILFGSLGVAILFPLGFAVLTAFRNQISYTDHPFWPPGELSFHNFVSVWNDPSLFRSFGNSILLSVGSSLTAIGVSALAAFGFVTGRFPGKSMMFSGVAALMVIPAIVLVVPLYQLAADLGLGGSYLPALTIYAALLVPFATYMLAKFFEVIPTELREAASLDCRRSLQVFWNVYLPLVRSGLIVLFVINMVWVWNDLLIALIFLDPPHRTIMANLAWLNTGSGTYDVPFTFAALVCASLPVVAIFVLGQRFLVGAFMRAGVKG